MNTITNKNIEDWLGTAAAITLRQPLVSALTEDAGHRVYPPTFPDEDNYFVDAVEGGGNRSIIDTKQSQARRLASKIVSLNDAQSASEKLIPDVTVGGDSQTRSVGEIGHRVADAAVLLADGVNAEAEKAIKAYADGDSTLLGIHFPESILFGFWDSHGILGKKATMAKRSRLIHSEIYAYEVSPARSRSVYVAVVPMLVGDEEYNAEKEDEKLSKAGLANVPGKLCRDGVIAKRIERSAEINLATLRQIKCLKDGKVDAALTSKLHTYLLTLALAALLTPDSDELNLRSGAHLVPLSAKTKVQVLMRDGTVHDIEVPANLLQMTAEAAKAWFKAATGSATAPVLTGKISKGKVGEVRKSLKKGKAAPAGEA
jgi:CRISPR-associated protein Csb1